MPVAVVFVIGVVALMVVLLIVIKRAEKARIEALKNTATAMKFSFEAEGDVRQIRALGDLPVFSEGQTRKVTNLMTGRAGDQEVKVFDYWYSSGGGKKSQSCNYTVVLYPGGARALPDCALAPENAFLDKIYKMAGYKDIDFDDGPTFSAVYMLRGNDETAIRAAFTPERRAFLEQHQGWCVQVASGTIGFFRNQLCKPEQVSALIEETNKVRQGIVGSSSLV